MAQIFSLRLIIAMTRSVLFMIPPRLAPKRGFTHTPKFFGVTCRRQGGFTLIETILYIGLFAILVGGILVSVYPIFTNTGRSSLQVTVDTEAGFLLRKFAWALSSINAVTDPALGDIGGTLTIDTL